MAADRPTTHRFDDDGAIPNSELPVVLCSSSRPATSRSSRRERGNVGSSGDFLVVGAYPHGQDWDLRRGDPAEHDEAVGNIERVPLPEADPVRGPHGPLLDLWTSRTPSPRR